MRLPGRETPAELKDGLYRYFAPKQSDEQAFAPRLKTQDQPCRLICSGYTSSSKQIAFDDDTASKVVSNMQLLAAVQFDTDSRQVSSLP